MNKVSMTASLPIVHKSERKKLAAIQFPLFNDVTILQSPMGVPPRLFNWRALKSLQSSLKLGQILAAFLTLLFIRPRLSYHNDRYFWPDLSYFIFAFTALIGTVILLADAIFTNQPHGRAFSSLEWFRVNLWYNGLVVVGFYTQAFSVLVLALWDIRSCSFNIVAAAFGFVATVLYAVDWWMNFCGRREVSEQSNNDSKGKAEQVNLLN
nr:uncharacterized protein LOC109397677 [Aedes albopictus]